MVGVLEVNISEFYPEKQGRPESKVVLDMDSRAPSVSYTFISTIVNQILEDAMDEKLAEIVTMLYKLLVEVKQAKLHLASISGEPIDEDDV